MKHTGCRTARPKMPVSAANSGDKHHERVYIGKDRREKINRIIGRIGYTDLTANSKAEVLSVLEELIANHEQRFVTFFNNSQAITPRMHALELLPGIGKKSMWQIINAREKKQFTSF